MSRFLSVPFKITNSGEVAYTSSPKEVIKQYVACVILTNLRERVFRPTYGSTVSSNVFEAFGTTRDQINDQISSALQQWLPDVRIESVNTYDSSSNGETVVDVVYTLPDGTSATLTLTRGALLERTLL